MTTRLTRIAPILLVLAGIGFLATPSHPASGADGIPLQPIGVLVALLIPSVLYGLWGWLPPKASIIGATFLLALTVGKLIVAAMSPESGLQASYYENQRFNGRPEKSSDYRLPYATRLDRAIDFGGDEFPVYFFNDSERFNFFSAGQPQRRQLPFSARWTGVLLIPLDGAYTIRLTASGPGSVEIGNALKLAVDADGRDSQERSVQLAAGEVPISAEYSRRPQRSPDFRIDWLRGGRAVPLAEPYLRPSSGGPSLQTDAMLRSVAIGLNVIAAAVGIAILALSLREGVQRTSPLSSRAERFALWERPLLSLVPLAFALYGAAPRMDRVGKMVYLGGGQDWLMHETLARDILINGPLMTLGKDVGEGRAFYAQPLYPYFLAAQHWLFGEDQFGVTAAQVALLGFTCVIIWSLARRLYGRGVAWLTLALIIIFAVVQLDWVARRLISESLYFVVLPACLLACVIAHQNGGRLTAAVAGVLMGISVLTRGTTLLLLPVAAVLLGRRRGAQSVILLTGAAALIMSLAPMRNAIVSGRPALLATSGGVNMEKFHRPSDVVRFARADDNPIYNALGLDKPTREVLEFMIQDPAGYVQACLVLAAYTVGFGFALDEAQVPLYPDLIAYAAIYLLTLILVARARIAEAWYVHAFIAIHFLAMVIFTPYDYENRLVLPMFIPMLAFVALGMTSLASTLARLRTASPPLAAPRMQTEISNGR